MCGDRCVKKVEAGQEKCKMKTSGWAPSTRGFDRIPAETSLGLSGRAQSGCNFLLLLSCHTLRAARESAETCPKKRKVATFFNVESGSWYCSEGFPVGVHHQFKYQEFVICWK